MINEVHPAVDARFIKARREEEAAKKLSRKKAKQTMRLRAIIAASLVAVLLVFAGLGLMDWSLALPFVFATGVWLAVWFGAWLQFMFAEGGLLDVVK